jgi:hypothetical protein
MKKILVPVLFCFIAVCGKSQGSLEKVIKTWVSGYEKKDWNMASSQLANDFTFTSPAGDANISLAQFKEKCWPTSAFAQKVDLKKISVDGSTAFVLYDIHTTDNKLVHNVEYYTFKDGKIKSIECFFGAGANYPGSGK